MVCGAFSTVVLCFCYFNIIKWNFYFEILSCLDIDKLVCIKGMIIRNSQIIPDMKAGFFKCSICNNSAIVEVDRGRIQGTYQSISDVMMN